MTITEFPWRPEFPPSQKEFLRCWEACFNIPFLESEIVEVKDGRISVKLNSIMKRVRYGFEYITDKPVLESGDDIFYESGDKAVEVDMLGGKYYKIDKDTRKPACMYAYEMAVIYSYVHYVLATTN